MAASIWAGEGELWCCARIETTVDISGWVVCANQLRLPTTDWYQSLNYDVRNLLLQQVNIEWVSLVVTLLFDSSPNSLKRPFVSLLSRIVCCEIRVVLINCIVGKVNERIVKRLQFVLLCSKAAQTIFVDKHAQRLHVGHEHVNS